MGVGWVKNCQKHPYVINEWPLTMLYFIGGWAAGRECCFPERGADAIFIVCLHNEIKIMKRVLTCNIDSVKRFIVRWKLIADQCCAVNNTVHATESAPDRGHVHYVANITPHSYPFLVLCENTICTVKIVLLYVCVCVYFCVCTKFFF